MKFYKKKNIFCSVFIVLGLLTSSFVANVKLFDQQVYAEDVGEVLYVNFDDNVEDQSGHGNNGTIVGNPLFVKGVRGNALHIQNLVTGSTSAKAEQYVDFGKDASLQFGNDNFALSFWYSSDNGVGDGAAMIANKNYNTGANAGFAVGDFSTGLRFNFTANGASRSDVNNFAPIDGNWHHVVINVNRSNTIDTYLDGTLVKTLNIAAKTGSIDAYNFIVGADGLGNNGLDDAYIDELHVYRGCLSTTKIEQLYGRDVLALRIDEYETKYQQIVQNSAYDEALLAAFRNTIETAKALQDMSLGNVQACIDNMDVAYQAVLNNAPEIVPGIILAVDFNDETANDSSGNKHHGTMVGNPEFVDGIYGKAIHIRNTNGSGTATAQQYVNFGAASTLQFGSENFAISFWYKTVDGGASEGAVFSNKNWSTGANQGFTIGNFTNGLRMNFTAKGNSRKDIYGINATDDKWHFVVVNVNREGTMIALVDGNEVGRSDISVAKGATIDTGDFVLGADGLKHYGLDNAIIDEVRVYNRLMSQAEQDSAYVHAKLTLLLEEYSEIIEEAKVTGEVADAKIIEFEQAIADIKEQQQTADDAACKLLIKKVKNAYDRFLQQETPLFSFQVISDPHIQAEDRASTNSANFLDALQDIETLDPTSSALVVPGDLTDSGSEAQYRGFYDIINNFNSTPNSVIALGNHDVRWLSGGWTEAKDRYMRFNKDVMGDTNGEVYYDKWIDGYHFIVLNTEKDLRDQAYLSAQQLAWLDTTLEEHKHSEQPTFLIIHQALQGTYEQVEADLIEQSEELKAVLKKYPQVIMFTGHIHNGVDLVSAVNIGCGTQVDVPAFYYSSYGSSKAQVGYQVNVYENYVQLKIRDFKNDEWLSEYDMQIDFKAAAPNDASKDVPLSELEVFAGSQQLAIENIVDEQDTTFWQGEYAAGAMEDQYVIFDLTKPILVDGVRYLPRQTTGSGKVLKYEVYTSDDLNEWTKQADGKWFNNKHWQNIMFDKVKTRYVKVQVVSIYGSGVGASIAEMRVTQPELPNKLILQNEIIIAEALLTKVDVYTADSLSLYQQAVHKAKQVVEDDMVDQATVDEAVVVLKAAKGLLQEQTKSDKQALLELYTAMCQKQQSRYTQATWEVFASALDKAEAVLSDGDATQPTVDASYQSLVEANEQLITQLTSKDGRVVVEGKIADNVSFVAEAMDTTINIGNQEFMNAYDIKCAYNLELYADGEPYIFDHSLKVTVHLEEKHHGLAVDVAHIDEFGKGSILAKEHTKTTVSFTTKHFSTYAVVVKKAQAATSEDNQSVIHKVSASDTSAFSMWVCFALLAGFIIIKKRKYNK